MPLPLLLIPAVAAAAATYSTGAVVGIAVGAGIGGAGATAGGVASWWYFWRKPKTPSQTHEDLLKEQHEITQQRIEAVDKKQNDLAQTTHAAMNETTGTLLAAAHSTDKLKKTAKVLMESTSILERTTQTATKAGEALLTNLPTLQNLSSSLQESTEKTRSALNELGSRLQDDRVTHLTDNVKALTALMIKQTEDITQLSASANLLAEENQLLKSTFAAQSSEIANLETEVTHTQQNLLFFKAIAQAAMTQQSFPAPVNVQQPN